jgi:hypothetical protein
MNKFLKEAGETTIAGAVVDSSKKPLKLKNDKNLDPPKESKMASLLDPKSAVYFRSGQLHKIAAPLVGADEVTIADAVKKLASDAYILRAEKARIAEGLVALESI